MIKETLVKELNTYFMTFLIKFRSSSSHYITQDLVTTMRKHENNCGIDFIKIYDSVTQKFKNAKKSEIINYHMNDDDNSEYLANHYYFN